MAAAQVYTGANSHWGDDVIRLADEFHRWLDKHSEEVEEV